MATDTRFMMEIPFNVGYLVYILCIVALMTRGMKRLSAESIPIARQVWLSFLALAIGDLGHVGARIYSFSAGGLQDHPVLLGIGGLAEELAITALFMFWAEVWRLRFGHPRNAMYWVLMIAGVIHFAIMIPPQNQWTSASPPYDWVLYRNLPWVVQGFGVGFLMIKDGRTKKDALATRLGIYICLSHFIYNSAVYLAAFNPVVMMLMIPGTIVYMVWQYSSYKGFFVPK
jgi:hypothetical protein